MNKETLVHCKFLDGTDGLQCGFTAPYLLTINTPTKAHKARGDKETDKGIVEGASFLHCIPAIIVFSKRDSEESEQYSNQWLCEEQGECNKYEPFGT